MSSAAGRLRDADQIQHLDGAAAGGPAIHALMQPKHLDHLGADLQVRVQRGHRVLEDHGNLLAPDAVQGGGRQSQDLLVAEPDAARGAPVAGQQAHDRHEKLALAGAGFPDHADRFAGHDIEADIVDGAHLAVGCREAGRQVAY